MNADTHNEIITALQWYVDQGVTDALIDEVIDRTAIVDKVIAVDKKTEKMPISKPNTSFLGKLDAYDEALKLANSSNSLEVLQKNILDFDGVTLKKTATNMVFSCGNPNAKIMIIGDAPMADDDRTGTPFSGEQGHLLDKMLACIDLDRNSEDLSKAVYLSNILNWRPPGNRSPLPSEISVSLPFIERHIQLIKPDILVFLGGLAAKSLLGRNESLSRLRKTWHDYIPQTKGLIVGGGRLNNGGIKPIPAIASHSISALIKTPSQKKSAWEDLLSIQELYNNSHNKL